MAGWMTSLLITVAVALVQAVGGVLLEIPIRRAFARRRRTVVLDNGVVELQVAESGHHVTVTVRDVRTDAGEQ